MNKGLLGIPSGASDNAGRAVKYGPFRVTPGGSVVLGCPFERSAIAAVIYECVAPDLGWPVGSLVQEWVATISTNGHSIVRGRGQVTLNWATNVRLMNKATSAQSAITPTSWLAWVVFIG